MTDRFEVGEVAILVYPKDNPFPASANGVHPGTELLVVGPLEYMILKVETGQIMGQYWAHMVEVNGRQYACPVEWLRKKPPKQEPKREELGEWDLCPWKPGIPQTVTEPNNG